MINQNIRDQITEVNEEAIVFDNPSFDNSIIGLSEEGCVVYDYYKMVEELAKDDNISEEEAMEFIDYNTLRAIPYANSEYRPIVVTGFLN